MKSLQPVPPAAPASLQAFMQAWPLRSFIDEQGRRWLYRDNLQAAQALVLLPGALGTGDMAFKLAQGLGQSARSLSITYPGGAPPAGLATGLAQLLAHLGLERVAVWGSSYGAWWAQAFAAQYPLRVSRLWLGNTLVDGQDLAGQTLFAVEWLSRASGPETVRAWHAALASRPAGELITVQAWMLDHGLEPEAFRLRLLQVASAQAQAAPQQIAPTVVFDCEDDPVIGAATRARVRQRYPQAQHISLPQGGHYPHITHTEELLVHVREWLGV